MNANKPIVQTAIRQARWALILATLLALTACGDDGNKSSTVPDNSPDMGMDVEQPDVEEPDADADEPDADDPVPGLLPTEPQDGVSPEGADIENVAPGEVRAGIVRQGTGLITGVQQACRPGCFVLANDRARFCVEGVATGSNLFFDGGRIIDAIPQGAPEISGGRDRLDILSSFIDSKTSSAQNVEVIRDGTDGELAVVRVTGIEEPSSYLAGVLGPAFFRERPVEVVTEYRLRPGSASLEIVSFATNRQEEGRLNIIPGDILFWGDTLDVFFPRTGRTAPRQLQTMVAYGQDVAYGWFTQDITFPISLVGVDLPAWPLSQASAQAEVDEAVAWRRWLTVGINAADVLESWSQEMPEHPGHVLGQRASFVVTRGGQPLPNVQIEAVPSGDIGDGVTSSALAAGFTDAQGVAEVYGTVGNWTVLLTDPQGETFEREIDLSQPGATIALPEIGALDINVTELLGEEQAPSPAKVRLTFADGGPNAQRLIFVLRGQQSVDLKPGLWRWEVSRGSEFTVAGGEVTVEAGSNASLEATIERVVPTPGFVTGEFHQHQTPSLDSEVPLVDRVLSNIAEGVDFAVSSDHDVVTDFGPAIEELGAGDLIASVTGVEVSPLFGHFGAYPATFDPDKPGNGALTLSFRDGQGQLLAYQNGEELIAAIRSQTGARMIQVNHPRDNSPYFSSSNWDRTQPIANADDGFSLDFNVLEVVNGSICEPLQDWYTLLNLGQRVVGVGNSDTHNLTQPVGYPRNYVPSEATNASELNQDDIVDGVLSGDVVISAIAYLEFGPGLPSDPDAVRPGRLVSAESVTVDVRALTPPWAKVSRLYIVRNGLVIDELEIGAGIEEIVDFDGPIELNTQDGQDAWFQIIAYDPDRAAAVYPGQRVYAIGNPFFLDANDNGQFDAPGLVELAPETIAFCQP